MTRKAVIRIGMTLVVCAIGIAIGWHMTSSVKADTGLKGVICHATGSSSNPYVGVIVGIQDMDGPIFSNNGHLDANGSTLSGHEHDIYIGSNPPNEKRDCDKLPPPPKG